MRLPLKIVVVGLVLSCRAVAQVAAKDYATQAVIPDDMRGVAQEASDLFLAKHYEAAAAKYQFILKHYPNALYAWSNLGATRFEEAQSQGLTQKQRKAFFLEASEDLRHGLQLSPHDEYCRANLSALNDQLRQIP